MLALPGPTDIAETREDVTFRLKPVTAWDAASLSRRAITADTGCRMCRTLREQPLPVALCKNSIPAPMLVFSFKLKDEANWLSTTMSAAAGIAMLLFLLKVAAVTDWFGAEGVNMC